LSLDSAVELFSDIPDENILTIKASTKRLLIVSMSFDSKNGFLGADGSGMGLKLFLEFSPYPDDHCEIRIII